LLLIYNPITSSNSIQEVKLFALNQGKVESVHIRRSQNEPRRTCSLLGLFDLTWKTYV